MCMWCNKVWSKSMIKNTQIDHELLEEFREELTPRLIGNCGHTPQLTDNMVKALYHVITDFLVRNSDDNLSNDVMQSLGEIP